MKHEPRFNLPPCRKECSCYLLPGISTQPAPVKNNEHLPNRQTWKGIPVAHPRNLTLGVVGRTKFVPCLSRLSIDHASLSRRRQGRLYQSQANMVLIFFCIFPIPSCFVSHSDLGTECRSFSLLVYSYSVPFTFRVFESST